MPEKFDGGKLHTGTSARVPLAFKEHAAEKSLQVCRRAAAYESTYRIAPVPASISVRPSAQLGVASGVPRIRCKTHLMRLATGEAMFRIQESPRMSGLGQSAAEDL